MSIVTPRWLVAPHRSAHARPTISDVARVAGVNKGTASRALRGLSGVGELTRSRVLQAADDLAYSASHLATTLATGQSGIVGIVLPSLRNWYFVEVAAGASDVLHAAGFRVELVNLNIDSDMLPLDTSGFHQVLAELGVGRGRDLIMYAGATSQVGGPTPPGSVPAASAEAGLTGVASILIDHCRGARLAGEHLVELGHRRIATIEARVPGKPENRLWDQRRAGFQEALDAVDVHLESADIWAAGHAGPEYGRTAMTEILASARGHTAVFCQTDELAFGALAALRDAGLRVPDDMSVIGFDGHPLAPYWGLTTIDQHAAEQGARAADTFLAEVRGEYRSIGDSPAGVRENLVVRTTTGRPASSAPAGIFREQAP